MFGYVKEETLKQKAKRFFFPFSPIKSFRSVRLLFLIAILLALRIVLGWLSIKIAPFGLSISIAWVPLMVMGWYFGPVAGLFLGILTDTISFLMAGGGIWFWLYAIQEPVVGLISGLIAGFCRIRQNRKNNSIALDIIINQILVLGFAAISYVTLIYWLNVNPTEKQEQYRTFYEIYRWVVVGCLSLLIVIYEILIGLTLTKRIGKKDHRMMINFIYTSCLVILLMLVFSIALGPITAVEYAKFISGGIVPEQYLKYGSLIYLVPRVAVESIKIPVEASCLFGVVCLFDTKVVNIVNKINNSWQLA